MSIHTIVCRTVGCEAEGAESQLVVVPEARIFCAGCGEQITDISPPIPAPDPEPDIEPPSPAE